MIKKNLFLGILLCMLVIPASVLAQSSPQAGAYSERDAQSLLSAFMSYTDLRIASIQKSLEILAATSEAKSGKWDNMKGLLGAYQKSEDGLNVWYARPDGTYYIADKGLMDQKLSDRAYFPDLMAGKTIIGALVVGKSTGQRSAVIAVPVRNGGKVVGAIGATLFLDRLSEQIASVLDLRKDASFFALAPNGLTTLNSRTEREFLDPRQVGSESLKKAADEMLSGTAGRVTYVFDNANKIALYRTSPLTQWRFAIALGSPLPK
ncbi:MAG: methyl-accepting chemotaxis protein [Rhodocyclaceae bacterium]|nr:methyl-accepting chemotaxis protein [Rhodocyclaceae bacterium]